MSPSAAAEWLERSSRQLSDFSSEIGICIDNSDWEKLADVLALRQSYLERFLSTPISEECRDAVRRLVERTLEQDAVFQSKIQDKKNRLIELQSLLGRGRRAIQAYSGQ